MAGSSAEGRGDDFEKSLSLWGIPHPLFEQVQTITEAILGKEEAQLWLSSQGPSLRSWYLLGLDSHHKDDPSYTLDPENALLIWQNYFCHTHLPVQILNWVGDRMEMANTLEGRTPFLSGAMRRFVAQLPDIALVQGFTDKAILRKSYASQFERNLALTPKKQFNAPFIDFQKLYEQFEVKDVLNRMGINLNGSKNANSLLEMSQKHQSISISTQDKYLFTHRLAALQTLLCSSIVQRTLVDELPLTRDHEFEASILSQGGPKP